MVDLLTLLQVLSYVPQNAIDKELCQRITAGITTVARLKSQIETNGATTVVLAP